MSLLAEGTRFGVYMSCGGMPALHVCIHHVIGNGARAGLHLGAPLEPNFQLLTFHNVITMV